MNGHDAVLAQLRDAVGSRHVLTGDKATRRFRRGYRFGEGPVLAVVRPGTLLELWRVLQAAVQGGAAIILQAANTGLTGGSTPDGNDYGRPIVLASTLRLTGIQLLNEGRQVLCLPGATLDRLEQTLAPLGREPHSVIGSSCIGASVLGGICNNSGGALVRRGPAYTELALYAQVDAQGQLQLVNHLGIALGDTPEQILQRLQAGDYRAADVGDGDGRAASDPRYAEEVRRVDADTPARFNADPSRHFEAAGSAGKLAVFAVRLDTFEKEAAEVFYIGSNRTDSLTAIRRQLLTGLLPSHLPRRMGEFRQRYEHHLLLKVSAQDAAETEAWLRGFFADHEGGYFHCTADEGRKAFLHRFAVAGAAVRYREVHRDQVQDIVALDIALRRDDADWFEQLPADIDGRLLHKLYYGHFLCHVFHQDYIARKGEDPMAIEHAMWALLDQRGAEYPAEHNVGHLYPAKPALAGFYKQLDPSNTFNPGIGQTSKAKGWGSCDCSGH